MAKENYLIALDNLLKRYNKDRVWLSILCDEAPQTMEKFFSSKKLSYGDLQGILAKGGITLTISIQGEAPSLDKKSRMAFLRQNIRYHGNSADTIRQKITTAGVPDLWWQKDDITMQDLSLLERTFPLTFLYKFTGMGTLPDIVKSKVDRGVNWKAVSPETLSLFRKKAEKLFKKLSEEQRKELYTRAVLKDYVPQTVQPVQLTEQPAPETEPEKKPIPSKANDTMPQEAETSITTQRGPSMEETYMPDKSTRTIAFRCKTKKEFDLISKMAYEKGLTKSAMVYNLLNDAVFNPKKNGSVPTAASGTEKNLFASWMNTQEKRLTNAYRQILKQKETPWDETQLPLGADSILAIKILNPDNETDTLVLQLAANLQNAVKKGSVPARANEEATLEQQETIETNRKSVIKIQMREEVINYLRACGKNAFIDCEPSQNNEAFYQKENLYITRIECKTDNGEDYYLVYSGYKTSFLKKTAVSYKETPSEKHFEFFDKPFFIARLAKKQYQEYAVIRTRETVYQAADNIKESLGQIDSAITAIKKNFRIAVAQLIENNKNEEFIDEHDGKMYSKPTIENGLATIIITTNKEERRWTEEEIPLPELAKLMESIKKFIS